MKLGFYLILISIASFVIALLIVKWHPYLGTFFLSFAFIMFLRGGMIFMSIDKNDDGL